MHLYTLVLDYAGGTFVSQVRALNEQDALVRWMGMLSAHETVGLMSAEVVAAFRNVNEQPVALEGLTSAWCASGSAQGGLALVNIVRTAP
jgi:hypothetical protein